MTRPLSSFLPLSYSHTPSSLFSTSSSPTPSPFANASREAQEARIRELKLEIAREKSKKETGGRMMWFGAGAFAFSELLSGVVAVACILAWVGYCVDWKELVGTKEKAIGEMKKHFNRQMNEKNIDSTTPAANTAATTPIETSANNKP